MVLQRLRVPKVRSPIGLPRPCAPGPVCSFAAHEHARATEAIQAAARFVAGALRARRRQGTYRRPVHPSYEEVERMLRGRPGVCPPLPPY